MNDALIGCSGLVGGTLLARRRFAAAYRSTTIEGIAGRSFDRIYCAGAPAEKWKANRDPVERIGHHRLSGTSGAVVHASDHGELVAVDREIKSAKRLVVVRGASERADPRVVEHAKTCWRRERSNRAAGAEFEITRRHERTRAPTPHVGDARCDRE
jgi:hypothetical protein